MLIIETGTADTEPLIELAEGCPGPVEIFAAEDGGDGLILCGEGEWDAVGSAVHPAEPCLTDGRFGADAGPYLLRVGASMPEDFRTEFLAWYQIEHLPILLSCPEWDGCRILEEPAEDGCRFQVLHQASDPSAWESKARRRARATPWFGRLEAYEWFAGLTRRHYRRIQV